MKLAEALMLRSEYQKKLENLQNRIQSYLHVQEGERPAEDPQALIEEALQLNDAFCALVKRINASNNVQRLPDGRTLSEAIVERDSILKKRNLLASVANHCRQREFRVSRMEIKLYVTVDLVSLQKRIDDLSRQHRELDALVQACNWTAEID